MIEALVEWLADHPCADGAACARADRFLVIAETIAQADRLLDAGLVARERFESFFGVELGSAALVMDPDRHPQAVSAAHEAGYEIVKVWLSSRRVVEQARGAAIFRMPRAREALDRMEAESEALEAETVAHELGHAWFMSAFDWPERPEGSTAYGVDAVPDWLDESAAVLLEGPVFHVQRWDALCQRWPEDGGSALTEAFFDAEHPSIEQMQSGQSGVTLGGGSEGVTFRIMTSDSPDGPAQTPGVIFYPLARALIDYVDDSGEDAAFWGRVARVHEAGGTLEDWLGGPDAPQALPRTIGEFARNWANWITEACAAR